MENVSKAWDWNKNTQDFWNDPAEESYYLVDRWKRNGYARFLDLGCGLGRHSLLFADNGFRVDSYDLSNEAIERLSRRVSTEGIPNIRCAQGDMKRLPYGDNSFDCLLAYHVISHTDSIGIRTIIDEIHRVLKPGGEFYLTLGSKSAWIFVSAGYPKHDENTIIKTEEGPEKDIPHFYSDEKTIDELFARFTLIHVTHTMDIIIHKTPLRDSWHYFLLGTKE